MYHKRKQAQKRPNRSTNIDENGHRKTMKLNETDDPTKIKDNSKPGNVMMNEKKENHMEEQADNNEMDKENFLPNTEEEPIKEEFSNVNLEMHGDKEVGSENCHPDGEQERKKANNVQMTDDLLQRRPEDAKFSEDTAETSSKKIVKTMTLHEKVDYLKRLTQISTAYSSRVLQQLDNALTARIGKVSSNLCKPQNGNDTAPSTSGKNMGLVTKKKPVGIGQAVTLKNQSSSNMNCRVVVHDIIAMKEKDASCSTVHELSDLFEGNLKDFQMQGVEWLKILYENAVNGILADEMGLGKTVQTIALFCHLINKNVKGPFLVVAPLSTLPNWSMEFKKFCPKVPAIVFHGSISDRKKLANTFKKTVLPNNKKVYPIVIMSYEMVMREMPFLSKYKWKYLVVDEGHRLKNRTSKLSRLLQSVVSDNRLLLTGTPLQNNLEELWSLLHFLMPVIFGAVQEFEFLLSVDELQSGEIVEQEVKEGIISKMHMALSPFILRRLKKDVDLKLPPKKEILVYAPLSQLQWELYNAVMHGNIYECLGLHKNISEVEQSGTKRKCTVGVTYNSVEDDDNDDEEEYDWEQYSRNYTPINSGSSTYRCNQIITENEGKQYWINLKMQAPHIQLRKLCNHPYLVKMPIGPYHDVIVNEDLIKTSGKMMILDVLLPLLKARGHKVLLFSTMTTLLNLIEEYVKYRGYEYSRLDGNFKLDERAVQIENFMENSNVFLFLISTRAGSLGLNLTSADTVIIFDSDWNPQVDLQAQDRCHRIGQTKPVVVYRFVATATIDEKIVSYAQNKRRLEKLVLHENQYKGRRIEKPENFASVQELKDLLASKDYSKVVHTTGALFKEGELEELVDRSSLFE